MLKSFAACLIIAGAAAAASAQNSSPTPPPPAPAPVNQMCPIGKEPIDPKVATVSFEGSPVGFCCPSCAQEFSSWKPEQRRDFIALAVAHKEPGQPGTQPTGGIKPEPSAASSAKLIDLSAAYLLDTCPVSGQKLGPKAVTKTYDTRDVRFCCPDCVAAFEKDQAKYLKAIDEQLVTAQLAHYPMKNCLVMPDDELDDTTPSVIFGNRLVRTCCPGCVKKIKKDPAKWMASLDDAIVKQQSESYPLKTCPVSGHDLGSMGEPIVGIAGSTLVKFCCEGCIDKFKADPATYVAKINAAWQAAHAPASPQAPKSGG